MTDFIIDFVADIAELVAGLWFSRLDKKRKHSKKRRIIPDRYMQNGTQTPATQNSDTARSENYTYPKNTSAKRHAAGHAFPEIDTAALSFFKNLHPARFPPFIMHFCFPEVYSRWILVSMAGASPAPCVAPLTQESICCF